MAAKRVIFPFWVNNFDDDSTDGVAVPYVDGVESLVLILADETTDDGHYLAIVTERIAETEENTRESEEHYGPFSAIETEYWLSDKTLVGIIVTVSTGSEEPVEIRSLFGSRLDPLGSVEW